MIRFTPYAEARVRRRKLSEQLVEQVAGHPEQLLEEDDRKVAQSRFVDPVRGTEYLLRVVYETEGEDKLVITAYKTSKVRKYWRPS